MFILEKEWGVQDTVKSYWGRITLKNKIYTYELGYRSDILLNKYI